MRLPCIFKKLYFKFLIKAISLQSQNRDVQSGSVVRSLESILTQNERLPTEDRKKRPVRLGVRTLDFHSRNRGSIPLRATEAITT
jgi:hypothetical protein